MDPLTLAGQLRLVGAALIGMGLLHVALPRILDWPGDLNGTSLLTGRCPTRTCSSSA
ncbi:hypothetical protein [Streptomyces sp. Caat 7-52]|uniref:hypothetical protein n=1 Tax=Streptomyces sp. Caat 7-52 TaxID=2949637 RepID=UPI002035C64E|nr:hypothetical protein [Streptomyces sp. Caat 7-52]